MRVIVHEIIVGFARELQLLGLLLVPRIGKGEVLHRQPQSPPALRSNDFDRMLGSRTQPPGRGLVVAQRSRQADPARLARSHPLDAGELAQHLNAAISPHERMDLVDNDIPKILKQGRYRIRPVHQQPLKRLRGNLKHAGRLPHQLRLLSLGHVAVPVPYRNLPLLQQIADALELVVDQRLKRPDIQNAYRA